MDDAKPAKCTGCSYCPDCPPRPPKRKRRRSPFVPEPSALPPTARQDEFRAAIASLTAELGRGPSTGEIAARLGITRDGARVQLRALERKGLIGDVPKTVRSGRWALVGSE